MKFGFFKISIYLFFTAFSLLKANEIEIKQSIAKDEIFEHFKELFDALKPNEKKIIASLIYYQLKLNEASIYSNKKWQEYSKKLRELIANEDNQEKKKVLINIQRSGSQSSENGEEPTVWAESGMQELDKKAVLIANHVNCIRKLGVIDAINEAEKQANTNELKNIFLNLLNEMAEKSADSSSYLKKKAELLDKENQVIKKYYAFVYENLKNNKIPLNITTGFDDRFPSPEDISEKPLYPGYVPGNCPYLT